MRTSCGLYCGIVRPRRVIIMIMHCAGNRSFIKRHKSSATFLQFSACHGDMHQTYPAGHVERCILREYLNNTMHIYIYIFIYYVVVRPSACTLCAHFLYWCTVIEQFVGVKKIRVTYLFLLDVCPENTELDSIYPSTVAINSVTTTTTPQPLPRDFINICRHFLTHKDGPCSSPVLPSSSTSLIDLHKYAVIVRRPLS